MHDGALIIRDGRLYAGGCILPLTQREDISSQLGTRHRAAIGMTENSDAVVLVVSEETGTISIVVNGVITRDYNAMSAAEKLKEYLRQPESRKNSGFPAWMDRVRLARNQQGKEAKNHDSESQ